MTRINSSVISLSGGFTDIDGYSARTYFFNEESQAWTQGPDMNKAREFHGCSLMRNAGKQYLIVAGGYDVNDKMMNSVELLEIGSATWVKGPALPEPMSEFEMVVSPDSTGVIVIGGYDATSMRGFRNEVLEFKCESSVDSCVWKTILTLKAQRGYFIAIPIDREILKCQEQN